MQPALRTRPIAAGALRAFEAVARHLNFRAAAQELALTQPAVSRQIQALEDDVGARLFLRHTRAVELTGAGEQLLAAVTNALPRIDAAVRQIRQSAGRRSVALTTFASFASMWLIPRMERFQRDHPDMDIRIDASDATIDLELSDIDLALRHGPANKMPPGAIRLFGEQLTPMASPWLLKSGAPVRSAPDLLQFTLIEDAYPVQQDWLTWRRWFDEHGFPTLQPKRWLYFNYSYQMVAGRAGRTRRGAGAPGAGRGEPGQRRSGRAVAGTACRHALVLLADRGGPQRQAARDRGFHCVAAGAERRDPPHHRRRPRARKGLSARLSGSARRPRCR